MPGSKALITVLGALALGGGAGVAVTARFTESAIRDVSRCRGQNAEVESAADPSGRYVYEEWIGCRGIGFARSRDGGLHFGRAIKLRDSGSGSWDPAVTVSRAGTVYAAFMVSRGNRSVPVVLASFDHGATFPQRKALIPRPKNNWGDRPFIAAGPRGTVYLTWDYGPSNAKLRVHCYLIGSCALTAGELNVVMQISRDGGRTFGPMIHLAPGYPGGGGDSAPLVVDPTGRIDVLYQAFAVRNRKRLSLGPGHNYFTASADGGRTWSQPVPVGAGAGSVADSEWWIDGDIASDAAGNLYASWDTHGPGGDAGWLSYSTDHGVIWSSPVEVTRTAKGPNITQVAGGPAGVAYVGWLSRRHRGYVQSVRPFAIGQGWLAATERVSRRLGNRNVWPGDTFGMTTLAANQVMLSWGSAVHGTSEILATRVGLP